MNAVREIYLESERYNPRLRCTVPGAWVAEYDNGCTVAICPAHEAATADEARAVMGAA
jgi:hypothetical protein